MWLFTSLLPEDLGDTLVEALRQARKPGIRWKFSMCIFWLRLFVVHHVRDARSSVQPLMKGNKGKGAW